MNEMPKEDRIKEDQGSRDLTRKLLKEAIDALWLAAEELSKLRERNRKDVAYRYADADLGIAIATVEKVRIVMRKRKRSEKMIIAANDGTAVPPAPIGDEQ